MSFRTKILDAFLRFQNNHVLLLYNMTQTRSANKSPTPSSAMSVQETKTSNKTSRSQTKKKEFTQGIIPTEGESRFESYLAVLTALLGTQEIYKNIVDETSDNISIQTVVGKDTLPTTQKNNFNPIIYHYEKSKNNTDDDGDDDTHYRVYSYEKNDTSRRGNVFRWKIIDPYDLYQKKNSQGFCQMFAFYIATNNTDGFIDKTKEEELTKKRVKEIHLHNTFVCLQKTLDLMTDTLSPKLLNTMEIEFSDIAKDAQYGVSKNMKFSDFINDLKAFQKNDLHEYIASL